MKSICITTTTLLSPLTLSLLLFLSLLAPSFSAERCNPQDKNALLQIKQSFNNPRVLGSWNSTIDCCDWYLVECSDTTNRVIELSINSAFDKSLQSLSGQIPAAIGGLPFLETLRFTGLPNITGFIPTAIANLSNLTNLQLAGTQLSGAIPSVLGSLKNLNSLDLSFNKLTGAIPPTLSQLTNLSVIILAHNMLEGQIPEWTLSREFAAIDLSWNQLNGVIPYSFGNYDFIVIDFSFNMLSGDLSFMFGSNKSVLYAGFSNNLFEFNLSNVVFPASLVALYLDHNNIYGDLPVGLTEPNLRQLNVSYNRLCGKIPTGGNLQSFGVTSYFHNQCLCGAPLPAC